MEQLSKLKVEIPSKDAYSYDIIIGSDLLVNANEYVRKYTSANKFLIVTNETVARLYKDSLNIKNSEWFVLKDGEEHKNFTNYKAILDKALEIKMERKDCIIAFCGGVIGDMAGFAAATYMRGCDFIQIPTTLLAQVDSSVGGKVAINHANGKNLIGSFYQPKLVLTDISLLKTLDLRQLKTGLAEILKYAFLEKASCSPLNYRLFSILEENKEDIFNLNPLILSQIINICCSIKASIVKQDETEQSVRTILNLGHTFAHAIEKMTDYKVYTHGEAVAIGLKMAFNLSLKLNLITKDYYDKSLNLIDDYSLAHLITQFDKSTFYEVMLLDKKSQNKAIRFVLPNGDFSVKVFDNITKDDVFDVI